MTTGTRPGFPYFRTSQKMGKGSKKLENGVDLQNIYTWEDVKEHDKNNDKWIVLDGKIYNISNFMKRHPGGARVIGGYGGQDATVRF